MLRLLTGLLAVSASVALAAPDWGSKDWSCRAKVTAFAGAVEHQDQVIEQDLDFSALLKRAGASGAFDPNSPRVMLLKDGKEQEVPSRFFPEKEGAAKGRLCWLRGGLMAPGTEETYLVYFDAGTSKTAKSYPELAKFKPLMGPNLAQNTDMEAADAADAAHAAVWQYNAVQDAGTVERVKGGAHSGDYCIKIVNKQGEQTTVTAYQPFVVEPGRRYVLSGWMKVAKDGEGGYGTVSAWFSGKDGQAVPGKGGDYSNYKNQLGTAVQKGVEAPWTYFANGGMNVFDPATKTNHLVEDEKTLPGTFGGSLMLDVCYGKATVFYDDVEFRDVPAGFPIANWIAGVEKRP